MKKEVRGAHVKLVVPNLCGIRRWCSDEVPVVPPPGVVLTDITPG